MKRILYSIAIILLLVSAYFVCLWLISEPESREPLPTLLTLCSTAILIIIAWKTDSNKKVKVKGVKESTVDIDEKKDTDISVSNIERNSKVFINKGKDSVKNQN